MGWSLFRRKKTETENERYERLVKNGRITEGKIIDSNGTELSEITEVFYVYSISGADYESSQTLNAAQQERPADYAPGAKVSIRYDPRQPGNSVVV